MDPRYILIDDDAREVIDSDLDLDAFADLNGLDAIERADMRSRLEDGRASRHGGGASPNYSIRRVSP